MNPILTSRVFLRPLLAVFLTICFCAAGCGDSSDNDNSDQNGDLSVNRDESTAPAPTPTYAGPITDFLWKPRAESSYNEGLLVIHASPCNLDVVVNGEHLRDYGPGNGRCVTARSITRSGCGYGSNVKVEIFDTSTGLQYLFPDGNPYYIISNGCNRTEFRL
jgi:hypothetical protein